jgi:hypothetical protein
MVLSGATGRIYVNGNMTANMTGINPPTNTVRTYCTIASGNMVIDELKFYNRALSAAEILSEAQTSGPIV